MCMNNNASDLQKYIFLSIFLPEFTINLNYKCMFLKNSSFSFFNVCYLYIFVCVIMWSPLKSRLFVYQSLTCPDTCSSKFNN